MSRAQLVNEILIKEQEVNGQYTEKYFMKRFKALFGFDWRGLVELGKKYKIDAYEL